MIDLSQVKATWNGRAIMSLIVELSADGDHYQYTIELADGKAVYSDKIAPLNVTLADLISELDK